MTGHPLAEMADALDAAADRIDQAIEERAYVTPEVAADAERDSIRLRRTARVLRALHPGVARAALALAGGLKVPDGWSIRMDDVGDLSVASPGDSDTVWWSDASASWVACLSHRSSTWHPTPQAAVDAAVEALGGDPCR